MLQTVEAIVDPEGTVRLLEEVHVSSPTRAILTLLETPSPPVEESIHGGVSALLKFLEENRLPDPARLSEAEIDAQIHEEREAWD
jgi:hypothetical protein